jgi:hypothetical protein
VPRLGGDNVFLFMHAYMRGVHGGRSLCTSSAVLSVAVLRMNK